MALSVVDQTAPPPPGYTSQRDGNSIIQSLESPSGGSTEDLVSARSHPQIAPSIDSANPRHSDVHFEDVSPQPDSQVHPGMNRRRYTSLPYGSSVTFPVHLRYHHPVTTSSTAVASQLSPDNPYLIHLQEKSASQPAVRLNPTNYVSLSRKSTPHKRFFSLYRASASIKGPFTVNPYLHIPAALLSPARDRGDELVRKNLRFEVENGGINVNIFLVGDPLPDLAMRTTLDLKIRGGAKNKFPLIAKIHTPNLLRPPFHLSAAGIDGYLSIHLPASFHGLVSVKVVVGDLDAHISLSSGFAENSMILSETGTTRSYFVGELGGWSRDKQGWEGDKVDVSISEGKARLQILGEKDWDVLRKLRWNIGF